MQPNHFISVEALSRRYMIEYAPRKKRSSYREDQRLWKSYILPALGVEDVSSLTPETIKALHQSLQAKPTTANRVLSLLSKALNLAEEWGYRPHHSNPCRSIKKFPETKRKRVLNADEVTKLMEALDEQATQMKKSLSAIYAIKLLLFTGCYVKEILTLKWQYINFKHKCLSLPGEPHHQRVLLLSPLALDLLRSLSGPP